MTIDLVTIGESMLRISPPGGLRLEQANQVGLFVGGAESNLAVGIARMGKQVAWVSRLPANPLGQMIANTLREYGVDVSGVTWAKGERLGLYFVELASPPRPIRVWYDRAGSAASRLSPSDLPYDLIASARWLHLTGITPALSDSCAEALHAAMDHAHKNAQTVSFDVNYRALLWGPQAASKALAPYCKKADMVIVAARDAANLFGAGNQAEEAARSLQAQWGGTVIVTQGDRGACAFDGAELVSCKAFQVTMTDRLGAGDAFDAGLITRKLEGAPLVEAMMFGSALAALKLTVPGDLPVISRAEVEELLATGGSSLLR